MGFIESGLLQSDTMRTEEEKRKNGQLLGKSVFLFTVQITKLDS